LTVAGLILIGFGGWSFLQQQIEAGKPPPARILEVSIEDLEPSPAKSPEPPSQPTTSTRVEPISSKAQPEQPTPTAAKLTSAPVVENPAVTGQEETADVVPVEPQQARPEVTAAREATPPPQSAVSVFEAKLLEEASLLLEKAPQLLQEPGDPDEPAAEVPVEAEVVEVPVDAPESLAENPLLLAEVQEDVLAAAGGEDPAVAEANTGRPLTRIVAESIELDADVVPVGWESFVQDGVTTNVWRVADFAAGWHQNSMLPGQGGNVVLSAHHNIKGQVFRYTVDLEPGALITLYDEEQLYNYQVEDKFIVKDKGEPEAVRLENAKWIGPFNEERLTLITCWPFNSNTHRLIVIAKPTGQAQAAIE
jgi:sortase A